MAAFSWAVLFGSLRLTLVAADTDAQSHARQSYEFVRQGQPQEAEREIRESIRLAPDDPLYHSALAGIFHRTRRLEAEAADIHAALADLYAATGALDTAEREFGKAVRIDPANALYRVKQARNWLKLQRTGEAEQGFRKVLTMGSSSMDAYLNLGKIAAQKGDAPAAVRNLEKRLNCSPGTRRHCTNGLSLIASQDER